MSRLLSRTFLIGYLCITSFLVIFPILYVLFASVRPAPVLSGTLSDMIPTGFTLEHFSEALRRAPLVQQMLNSVIVALAQTLGQVLTGLLAAYALVFGRLPRAGLIFGIILVTIMIPGETILVANYLTIRSLGLANTVIAIFLPFVVSAYTIFLLRQTFLAFPKEIYEAAIMDGVGPLRFLFRFLVPLTAPTIMTVTLMAAIAAWNGYLWPLIVSSTPDTRTVQVGIKILTDESGSNMGPALAGIVIAVIPTILLVLIGQRFLARGLTQGAVK
ncbi:carbohydrate ABC transporter permease [Lysinibacter sp. HNR]|uniref:carbohydrate ABC transporter permease n=1 Tax=Lysinibacter sp. HNR TaxID=3031408 RepID=UPI002435C410|nr:carbohydrate ABC transporter permease [Lysinibacter sp. HNR]WGD37678.1 carbohydrate ABC transporter permease [Lysinibacter sp. HNR]